MAPTQRPENNNIKVIGQWNGSKTPDPKRGANAPTSAPQRQQNGGILPAQNQPPALGGSTGNSSVPTNDYSSEMSPERKSAWVQEQESMNLVGAASNILLSDMNQGGTPTGAADSASIDPAHEDLLSRLRGGMSGGMA